MRKIIGYFILSTILFIFAGVIIHALFTSPKVMLGGFGLAIVFTGLFVLGFKLIEDK